MAGRDDDLVSAPSFLDRCAPAASPILGTSRRLRRCRRSESQRGSGRPLGLRCVP